MSFFGKFKPGLASNSSASGTVSKKDPNVAPSALQKYLSDITEPIRQDGSDKFFGFENYGSTCYCNSIMQCLYYSAPFRENVVNFPPKAYIEYHKNNPAAADGREEEHGANGTPLSPRTTTSTTTPYPNPTSPARKPTPAPAFPNSPQKSEAENKESPEYKKKIAIQNGPVLDMTRNLSRDYGMRESLFTSMKDIFEAIIANKSRTGVVSPHKFLEILRKENEMFRSAMHQDAHEFLNLLLNSIVENVEQFSKQNPGIEMASNQDDHANGSLDRALMHSITQSSIQIDPRWVHDIFEGLLTSETRCLTCETVSQRDEAFLDLSVDLSAHTSVTSCLRKFSQEEMLCERNKFHCDACGSLQEAEKRMKIKRLPRILALHLKRFKYTEDLQRLQKLFHRVVYPYHLRLFNTTEDAEDADRLYELYAVVAHIGAGPYHGHYVSIVKTQDRGWLLFDDELVEPVDKSYVLNFFGGEPIPGSQDARQLACAYVLFYQETTLEAVLREQEMDGQPVQAAATAASVVPPAELSNGHKVDVEQLLGLTTPVDEEPDHLMGSLAHAMTAPPSLVSSPTSFEAGSPARPTILSSKSKKELKQDEKERKAAQKAEEKAQVMKQREASDRRVEALRKHDQETRKAIEASKQSAAQEAKLRNDSAADTPVVEKSGGFSRFTRPGSLSLRGRSKIFGVKDNEKDTTLPPPVSPTFALPHGANHDESVLTALPAAPVMSPVVEELVKENKEKKNRFSIGRKRSTQVL